MPAEWLARLRTGERVRFTDARDSDRSSTIVDLTDRGCWAELTKTAYFVPGTILRHARGSAKGDDRDGVAGELPTRENAILLQPGDHLIVTRDLKPGRPESRDRTGKVLTPAMIGCTIPEIFQDVRPGESIRFDDGKIGGVVEKIEDDRVLVRITQTRVGGDKLRADKGINLPESNLRLAALSAKDIEDLAFVVQHADIVELSFANGAQDVERLQAEMKRLGDRQPAIVLKIETRRGFDHLPAMLLTAMRSPVLRSHDCPWRPGR